MKVYKKISQGGGWNICYFVHDRKVIEILFSAKDGKLAGWSQNLLFAEPFNHLSQLKLSRTSNFNKQKLVKGGE